MSIDYLKKKEQYVCPKLLSAILQTRSSMMVNLSSEITLLLFLLFFIGSINVYGQISQQTNVSMYDNSISNEEIVLSTDKVVYMEGERVYMVGQVYNPKQGIRVLIQLENQDGNIFSKVDASVTKDGFFEVLFDIPPNAKVGGYTLIAQYGSYGIPVEFKISIVSESIGTVVTIPHNSHERSAGINFDPPLIVVEAGLPIRWINEDRTYHTVVSGDGSKMESDKKFSSGIIQPQKIFELVLEEGEYSYFCRLHPWLQGAIVVTTSTRIIEQLPEKEEQIQYLSKTIIDAEDDKEWIVESCQGCISEISLSRDKKGGSSSIVMSVKGSVNATGNNPTFLYQFEPVDINTFDSFFLWLKTGGDVLGSTQISLLDSDKKSRTILEFDAVSYTTWHELNLPLHEFLSQDSGFDAKSVSGILLKFPSASNFKGHQLAISVDEVRVAKIDSKEVELSPSDFLKIQSSKIAYFPEENAIIKGTIKLREANLPVTIQIFDPDRNLIEISQIVPDENKQFEISIPLSGKQFKKSGKYEIVSQYGVNEYQHRINFHIIKIPELVDANYLGYEIYNLDEKFSAIPISKNNPLIRLDLIDDDIFLVSGISNGGLTRYNIHDITKNSIVVTSSVGFLAESEEFQNGESITVLNKVGAIDIDNGDKIAAQYIPEYNGFSNIIITGLVSDSLEDLKNKIAAMPPSGPYLLEEYKGLNIFILGNTFYAIPAENKEFSEELLLSGEYKDVIVNTGGDLIGFKNFIDNPPPPPEIANEPIEEPVEVVVELPPPADLGDEFVLIYQIITVLIIVCGAATYIYFSARKRRTKNIQKLELF